MELTINNDHIRILRETKTELLYVKNFNGCFLY